MSGGVDSSVAAALLKEQGDDLIGVTMSLYCGTKALGSGCCSLNSARDAKLVADRLGFPHYSVNFKADFQSLIIDNFIDEYRQGRTPNPCIRCNQLIKFSLLLAKAKELGADYIATGHYARIPLPVTRYSLLKGKDQKKDQSYVLYRLTQEQLAKTLFPLGEMTKAEVRQKAKALNLAVADKPESQEICFVEDDDYGRFIRENAPELVRPGPIIDRTGKVVGEHQGIAFYTIGQRKGVGHHRGAPKYVVGLDRERNAVVIGDDADLLKTELTARELSFVAGKGPTGPMVITAKIRYNGSEAAATLMPDGKVVFEQPQRAVTPGQSVVFYQREEVLGGGLISS